MKKQLFILAVASVALASCSSDETVEVNQGDAISFRPLMNGVTRAVDQSASTLEGNGFKVTAIKNGASTVYIDDELYKNASGTYTCDNKYYWPSYNLDFYAYAPCSDDVVGTGKQIVRGETAGYKTFTVTPDDDASKQVDLIFAVRSNLGKTGTYETSKTYGADGIPLNFRHAESKICLKLKNTNTALNFTVKGWKIAHVSKSAKFTFGTTSGETDTQNTGTLGSGDWTDHGTAATSGGGYSEEWSNTISVNKAASTASTPAPTSGTVNYNDMILVPQTKAAATKHTGTANTYLDGAYIAIKLKATRAGDDTEYAIGAASGENEYVWACWPVKFDWTPGKKYTYTVDIGDGGYKETNEDEDTDPEPNLTEQEIKFVSVTVDEWDNGGETEVKLPTTTTTTP